MPSRISISPTANSIESPSRGGIATLKKIIAAPTRKIVTVCPIPHNAPITPALAIPRCLVTIVITATT